MDNEVENEINAILLEAISNDIQHTIRNQTSQDHRKIHENVPALLTPVPSGSRTKTGTGKDDKETDVPRCSVCCSQKPRYKCPACSLKTCSMECVKQHKIDENCSGKRSATDKVKKKSMGDRMLLSDYRFLEDAGRKIYGVQREYEIKFKPYPKGKRCYLHQQSMNKGFVLWNLPDGMSKRDHNTTVIGTVKGINNKHKKPMKLFQFHVKWVLHLSSGKTVHFDTKILETWNIGKLGERVIANLDAHQMAEFERSDVKAEIIEKHDEPSTFDSDDTGVVSGSSVEPPDIPPEENEIFDLGKIIERGKEKYVFNVFMQRICGPEKYYLFENDKTLRENLEGKAIIEYPELIISSPTELEFYHERLTAEVDYRKGKKPVKPSAIPSAGVSVGEPELEKNDSLKWKNKGVDMDGVDLEPWQKAALNSQKNKKRRNNNDKKQRIPNFPKNFNEKRVKMDPVHQLLISGLPPTQSSESKNPPTQKSNKLSHEVFFPTRYFPEPLPTSTQPPEPSKQTVTPTLTETPKQLTPNEVLENSENRKSPDKKPTLKNMMKMFDFASSDSESE